MATSLAVKPPFSAPPVAATVSTAVLAARLPDAAALPSGRYLVRVVLDIGLDHYIGVQREMEIRREPQTLQKPLR